MYELWMGATLIIVDMYITILRLCCFHNNIYAMPHLNVSV
jgi:hypothetical protein